MAEPDLASEIIGLSPPDQPDPRWQVRVRGLFGREHVLRGRAWAGPS